MFAIILGNFICICYLIGAHYIVQADLELVALLLAQPLKYRDYIYESPFQVALMVTATCGKDAACWAGVLGFLPILTRNSMQVKRRFSQ